MRKIFKLFPFMIFALAVASSPLGSETSLPDTAAALSVSNFSVPEEIGKVQERSAGTGGRMIIQIQDVHAHAVAQQNIAAVLERLRTMYGIDKIALEGAWSATSLPKSQALPTSRKKQLLASTLLDNDLISGPVYAALMSPDPVTLAGIEDETLYEKNRALFLAHLKKHRETENKLHAYGTSIQNLQKTVWGPDLLAFGTVFGKFRESSDLGNFFPLLLAAADRSGSGFSDLPQVVLLRDIMTLEKSLEKERLKAEAKKIIKKYKNRPWTLEELIRGGKIPPEEIGLYPEVKKLTRLYQLRDKVSIGDLTDQIGALTVRILEKLVRNPEEHALVEKTERFYLGKRLLLLQATPEDIQAFEKEKLSLEAEFAGAGLTNALALSVSFYATVIERDAVFFGKIMRDPMLAGNIAIVTGGFHTSGLSQEFRNAGIGYIVVTPELGGAAMNEELYNERMAEPYKDPVFVKKQRPGLNRVEDQTLSELRNRINIDDDFPPALDVLEQTNDVRKAEARFLGKTVAISQEERVRGLSSQNRLTKNAGPETVSVADFRLEEFMSMPHAAQLETVRRLRERAQRAERRSMLVSSLSVLKGMLASARSEVRVKAVTERGDLLALLQDIPATETPEALLGYGIRRFEAPDMDALVQKTSSFLTLAHQRPFVIMKNGYRSESRVVVDEDLIWLDLFPILTLNASLYAGAKNTAFLERLKVLWAEILSQELPKKSV